ncbi:PIG-L deacetylase family protein [Chloroflexota bacterium]
MNRPKTLVYFGAHPDDESSGAGSTLAQYAAAGAKVYYVCSTGGEMGTVDPKHLKDYETIKELRAAELKCAAQVLGLACVFYLDYRDSGMQGSVDNKHPDSLVMAPIEEVIERAVKIIREIKPDVVITHDDSGGYGHPDHIITHNAIVEAFYASGDLGQYPKAGKVFRPRKLYFLVYPRGMMELMVKLMPLFGQDPHHFGRNKDVDLIKLTSVKHTFNTVIRLKKESVDIRNKALACHESQTSGRLRSLLFRILGIIEKIRGPRDHFVRACPPPTNHQLETDLFEGLT